MIDSDDGRRPLLVAVALVVLAVVAAACAPGEEQAEPAPGDESPVEEQQTPADDASPAGDMEQVALRVGDVLGIPAAFLQYAVQEGFLQEQGLDVEVEPNPGGAANIPGVEGGDFEIAGSNVVSVLLARGQGLGVKMVSAGTFGGQDSESDFAQLLVAEDSPIREPADLDGKSIAINTLANVAEVTTRASLENAGAGHENIEFVEIGFPDMIPALQDDQVDAIFAIEPFLSVGLAQGLRPIIAPYAGTEPGMAVGSYFSSDAYIADNTDVVDRFIAGVTAAGDAVAEEPDAFREALVDLADLDPEVAQSVNLPEWGGPVDTESVQLTGDLMVRYGLLDEVPPLEDVVYQP
jgi:NitT/TauT family transport system substrate-binding protein